MTTAATVVLLRDGRDGMEVLLLRRSRRSRTFPGAWVFPGGAVEPCDGSPEDETSVRRAAVREVMEESGLVIEPAELAEWATWTPPSSAPIRHQTAFFLAPSAEGLVAVDDVEIEDAEWWSPTAALESHAAGSLSLLPPTWITLHDLRPYRSMQHALDAVAEGAPHYRTEINTVGGRTLLGWAARSEHLDITALPWRLVTHDNT